MKRSRFRSRPAKPAVTPAPPTDDLLLEDGSFLLQEDGSKILL